MAIYWFDSFQNYPLNNTTFGPWDNNSYGCIVTETGSNRSGTLPGWLGFIPGGVAGGSLKRIGVNRADSTIGFAVNFGGVRGTLPSAGNWQTLTAFIDSSFSGSWTDTLQIQLQVGSTGNLRVLRGTTSLAVSGTTPLAPAGWHYVEFYALINSTTGAFTVRVDGAVVAGLSLTSQNTQNTGNAYQNGFILSALFGGGGPQPPGVAYGNAFYVNDLYVLDSSGPSPNNTFLGDVRCIFTVPNGAGSVNNFTPLAPAWAASTAMNLYAVIIDSNGKAQKATAVTSDQKTGASPPVWATSTGSTTTDNHVTWTCLGVPSNYMYVDSVQSADIQSYVYDSTLGDQELYTITPLSGVPSGVLTAFAVGMDIRGQRDQTTTRAVRTLVKSGATQVDNGTDLTLQNGTFAVQKTVQALDPATSAQWLITAINAGQYGFKVSV